MEFLLLVTITGALIWLWSRMEALERRVAELEAAAHEGRYAGPLQPILESEARDAFAASPPPAEATPMPSQEQPEVADTLVARAARFRPSLDFEEIFGRLLPIWGGGIALAIAGFFLVRWSIEVGMLTQSVRVALGFAFGTVLIVAAELAYRFEHRLGDARVRQALAGAGLATLYASSYLAGSHYGLIAPGVAFMGLAGVTALAVLLSFRFGLPSAVLGLVGGFAAPALAGSTDPNLPLLATYLALVTGGLTVTGQLQQRSWLGLVALAVALGWGALMLVTAPREAAGVLAVGAYLVLVGTLLPSFLGDGRIGRIGRIVALGLATLQIAALVDRSGYGLLAWGCYLLLGAAVAVLGTRFVRLREAGAIGAALFACLLAAWPEAPGTWFATIATASVPIFAAAPLLHVWRGRAEHVDWAQLALYPIALIAAACVQLHLPVLAGTNMMVALGALTLTILPALAAWRAWPAREDGFAPAPLRALAAAFVLALLAGLLALPNWSAPLVTAALAVPAVLLLRRRQAARSRALPWSVALSGLVLLIATGHPSEVDRLFGEGAVQWLSALRWLAAALPFGLLLVDEADRSARAVGEVIGALLGFGAVAMLVPGAWLPLALALAVLGLAWRMARRGAAIGTLLLLSTLWAAGPLIEWLVAGVQALTGDPFLLGDLPSLASTGRNVAPLAAALAGAMLLRADLLVRHSRTALLAALSLGVVVAHVVFKQVFAIAELDRFVDWGLAERTLWQALLGLAALGLAALRHKISAGVPAALGLAVAALGHFALFSLVLNNPLWAGQAVGGWPIANLLLLSYGLAIGLTLWLRAGLPHQAGRLRMAFDAAMMMLVALLALSELRQLYSGNLLLDPVSQQEDLLRSILAIAVALGFLAWGARTGQRSWRIGSLVLMLLAVFKVFIFDAAGLEGLARIGSFFALGVCLIGIGWFYSSQLGARPAARTGGNA